MDRQKKDKVINVLAQVMEECERARKKHRGMVSTQEAHSVILEEFEEWWDSVKADTPDDKELLSVAAMAVLAIGELKGKCGVKQRYEILTQVMEECERSRKKHRGMLSTHEAHSIILKELEEWWDSVKANTPDDKELLSVAAMAVLAIVELNGKCVVKQYRCDFCGEMIREDELEATGQLVGGTRESGLKCLGGKCVQTKPVVDKEKLLQEEEEDRQRLLLLLYGGSL